MSKADERRERYAGTWAGKCQQLEDENTRLRAQLQHCEDDRMMWVNNANRLRDALETAAADARNFPITTVEPDYSDGYRDGREDVARQLEAREKPCGYGCLADGLNYWECPIHG